MIRDGQEDPWSVTEKQLRDRMRELRESDRPAAVATVADVEGSAYRRPGAKMVVPADGESAGSVTAGCLEGPVLEIAANVIETESPHVEVFDLMEDDDDTWGLGLGCNGIIDLFVEPVDASWDRALELLAYGEAATMVTVIDADGETPVGARMLVDETETAHEVAGRQRVPEDIIQNVSDTVASLTGSGKTRKVDVDGVTLLVDSLQPVPELVLFGSQNDLPPVARVAAHVGFRVTVYAARGAVEESAFTGADAVKTGNPTDIAEVVEADEHTYAVVMSHNLLDDRLALESLLRETAIPYVGLMGPRERFEQVRESISEEGDSLTRGELDRVSTPVGLDLGGGEPVQIALSIVGEVLAVSNDREGGRLRNHEGPIHAR